MQGTEFRAVTPYFRGNSLFRVNVSSPFSASKLAPFFCWFLGCLSLRPWRWRQYMCLRHAMYLVLNVLVIQNSVLLIVTSVRTSDPKNFDSAFAFRNPFFSTLNIGCYHGEGMFVQLPRMVWKCVSVSKPITRRECQRREQILLEEYIERSSCVFV
jgi:hypothetical protein